MIGHLTRSTLTVHRPAFIDDGMGGQTPTFAAAGEIRALVSQPTADEVQAAGQFGARLEHVVHTDYHRDVRRGDELDGDLPSTIEPGRRLRVWAVISDSHETYKRLQCEVTQSQGA